MEIRDYQPGDEKQILELFRLVFKKDMSTDFWSWRFANNPSRKIMIKLMWDSTTLAGHYAVSPVNLIVNNENILTALSMTTMTHPDYGGRGIFSELAESLYNDEYKKNNLAAIWGFPNTNSHYGFIKNLKWSDLEQIPSFNLNTAAFKLADVAGINAVNGFSEKHYAAFLDLTKKYAVRVDRNPEYLEWRYNQNPANEYTVFECLSGQMAYYAVAKVFPSFSVKDKFEIDLLEIMFPPDVKLIHSLLSKMLEYFSNHDIIRINTWLPLNDHKHILLEKLGFATELPVTYSGVRIMDPAQEILHDPRNWFYCMADSDIY
jgi:hypothetical protein